MTRQVWWVCALIACAPVVPEPVEDAGVDACDFDGGVCPSADRARCRVDRLQAAAATCRSNDDCTVFRFPPNCLDDGRCPGVAVSFQGESRFSVDATRELSAFCAATTCRPKLPCTETRTPSAECVSAGACWCFPTRASLMQALAMAGAEALIGHDTPLIRRAQSVRGALNHGAIGEVRQLGRSVEEDSCGVTCA